MRSRWVSFCLSCAQTCSDFSFTAEIMGWLIAHSRTILPSCCARSDGGGFGMERMLGTSPCMSVVLRSNMNMYIGFLKIFSLE